VARPLGPAPAQPPGIAAPARGPECSSRCGVLPEQVLRATDPAGGPPGHWSTGPGSDRFCQGFLLEWRLSLPRWRPAGVGQHNECATRTPEATVWWLDQLALVPAYALSAQDAGQGTPVTEGTLRTLGVGPVHFSRDPAANLFAPGCCSATALNRRGRPCGSFSPPAARYAAASISCQPCSVTRIGAWLSLRPTSPRWVGNFRPSRSLGMLAHLAPVQGRQAAG